MTAQVSLYPIAQADYKPPIKGVIRIFEEHGLRVTVGPLSTVVSGEAAAVFEALRAAYEKADESGKFVMVVTMSNSAPEGY